MHSSSGSKPASPPYHRFSVHWDLRRFPWIKHLLWARHSPGHIVWFDPRDNVMRCVVTLYLQAVSWLPEISQLAAGNLAGCLALEPLPSTALALWPGTGPSKEKSSC